MAGKVVVDRAKIGAIARHDDATTIACCSRDLSIICAKPDGSCRRFDIVARTPQMPNE